MELFDRVPAEAKISGFPLSLPTDFVYPEYADQQKKCNNIFESILCNIPQFDKDAAGANEELRNEIKETTRAVEELRELLKTGDVRLSVSAFETELKHICGPDFSKEEKEERLLGNTEMDISKQQGKVLDETFELTLEEINILERKNIHLTREDLVNINKTLGGNNVKLSEDRKAVFYQGKIYYIDVPGNEASINPKWKSDGKKKYSKMQFNIAEGLLGISTEEIPEKTVIKKNNQYNYVVRKEVVLSNDKNVKTAAGFIALLGITSFIDKSLSVTNIEMNFESYNNIRRVKILVGDSDTRQNMKNINFKNSLNIYQANSDNTVNVTNGISEGVKEVYKEITGENVPHPDVNYTMVANLNEKRKDMIYTGYLSYGEDDKLIYTPYVFSNEKLHISECSFIFGLEQKKILDCTQLLKQSTEVPENIKKILERAWES